ncbi:tRNA (uracil-5-)-methyltransferase homolog A isoform X2 [Dermatophagoides farinae]|uniref:tRNA (uracil-5-)-methyltransferase homolog A isoform X2 n=1 Tax=Dermatophagoides farinae TaxID=6954 RepID=UPI001F116752|nr:tRNA (uracil-5-)-methyltransferase homolog A-like isoform X2 [Dermatophagoides farinae]
MEEVNSIHNKPNENDDNKQQQKQRSEQSLDPLGYTQQQSQTSEIFKIEINNLPAFLKFLRKKQIIYRKMKLMSLKSSNKSHAYVTFRNEKERSQALNMLNNIEFRGRQLTCRESAPLPDPLIQRQIEHRMQKLKSIDNDDKTNNNNDGNKNNVDLNYSNSTTAEERDKIVNDQVCSLWNVPYDEQINRKIKLLKSMWQRCATDFKYTRPGPELQPTMDWFRNHAPERLKTNFLRSPIINGYRNKYEFSIGADRQVGFRLGLYREGSVRVVSPPENCPIINPQARCILEHFQHYLRERTTLDGYDPVTHEGYWRQILVRLNRQNEALISIRLTRQPTMTDTELECECQKLREHFEQEPKIGVRSVYVEIIEDRYSNQCDHSRFLCGETHIYERLKLPQDEEHLEFRISSTSFFQVNVSAAELLYGKIVELASCGPETIVLDICCGTGTIGLSIAKRVKSVFGFELNEEAVEDARFNVKHNGIVNVEFHCGRAEKLVGPILDQISSKERDADFVAILDPPRNGLPANIIKCLRNNQKIRRVIYVACEAMAARNNFIDLCRPISRAYHKAPFIPVETVAVDLFPHTERCELIVMFERISSSASKSQPEQTQET